MPARVSFNDLSLLVQRDNDISSDTLWKETPNGYRFAPGEELVRNIKARISGMGCEELVQFIAYSNVPPRELPKTLRTYDFATFRDMYCATALQVVLTMLRRKFPAPPVVQTALVAV